MTVAATTVAQFLDSAELASATRATGRPSVIAEEVVQPGTFAADARWSTVLGSLTFADGSSVSDFATPIVGQERAEDRLIAQVNQFRALQHDWDLMGAAAPRPAAIRDAVRFLRAAGGLAADLEPTVHSDGAVLLEAGDNGDTIGFAGDGMIFFAIGSRHGIVPFNGFCIPAEIVPAFSA